MQGCVAECAHFSHVVDDDGGVFRFWMLQQVPAGARQMKNTNRKKLMFVWTRYAHAAAVKLEIIRGGIDCNGYDGEVGHCGHKRIR